MNNSRLSATLWAFACSILAVWVIWLAVVTLRRISFPWDIYYWPESPFLTNMLKLENHSPIFTAPADGNSFVYSPGLEYLCFGLLKPFGRELDVRFCRLVVVVLGALAAVFAALAMGKIVTPPNFAGGRRVRFLAAAGIAWLVLSKNFMADICHPDNLQAFHAVSVFWLCLTALETRRFALGLLTMLWAGIGVFTKQTEAVAILGPAVVFAWFNPWGGRRWLLLIGVGVGTVAVSVYLLWLPHYARFFTYGLMSHQGVHLRKIARGALDMLGYDRSLGKLVLERGLLLVLAIAAAGFLWQAGATRRRYLIAWLAVGFFSVMPNLAAYLKTMGAYNNLILFELWFVLLAWPGFVIRLEALRSNSKRDTSNSLEAIPPKFGFAQCLGMIALIFLLMPLKRVPVSAQYDYCRKVEESIRRDAQAGRRVLVSHGTEFLIRAGLKKVPLDRCNSILELNVGGQGSLAGMPGRVRSHYYDRIYLFYPTWYGDDIAGQIKRDYERGEVIPGPKVEMRFDEGFGGGAMDDCPVMIPRTQGAGF